MILVNNVVRQLVPHLHLHVIPGNPKDGLRFWLGPRHPYDAAHPAEAFAGRSGPPWRKRPRRRREIPGRAVSCRRN